MIQTEADLKFAEWRMMEELTDGVRKYLRGQRHSRRGFRHTVYAVGSPRAFKVVAYSTTKVVGFFKVVAWDVRKGSIEFLLKEWDKTPWRAVEILK